MGIYKKILTAILLLLILSVSACSNENDSKNKKEKVDKNINNNHLISQFPLDELGYPKTDSIIVNGKIYKIKDINSEDQVNEKIDIQIDSEKKEFNLILPVGASVTQWSIEEKDILLDTYKRISLATKENVDGNLPTLQVFKFTSDSNEIRLKHHNVNELDKSFSDKRQNYLLTINVFYK